MHLYREMTDDEAYALGVEAGRNAVDVSPDAARISAYRFRDSIQLMPRSNWHPLTQRFLDGWQDGSRTELIAERIEEDGDMRVHVYARPYRMGFFRRALRRLLGR